MVSKQNTNLSLSQVLAFLRLMVLVKRIVPCSTLRLPGSILHLCNFQETTLVVDQPKAFDQCCMVAGPPETLFVKLDCCI